MSTNDHDGIIEGDDVHGHGGRIDPPSQDDDTVGHSPRLFLAGVPETHEQQDIPGHGSRFPVRPEGDDDTEGHRYAGF